MPEIEHYDADGDAVYAEPQHEEGWDLDAPSATMGTKALCAAIARDILGCKPVWSGYYCDWICSCDGNGHGLDSQCSAIATPDQLYDRVMDTCAERKIALLAGPIQEVLCAALTAWRARGLDEAMKRRKGK
jgi:hypothetical protein